VIFLFLKFLLFYWTWNWKV